MRIGELVAIFQNGLDLPVDVNQVLAAIISSGVEVETEFIGVELDTLILRGKYRLFHWPNGFYGGDPNVMAKVYYHRNDGSDWQRIVCCKEIIHLLDPVSSFSNTREQQTALAEKMGLPFHLQDPTKAPMDVNIDLVAEYIATAVLLPLVAREAFLEPLKLKKISIDDIALIADIPSRYVSIVMSATWPSIHEKLLTL